MIIPELETEICAYLHQLPLEQQRHVLEFVRALVAVRVRGVPGQALLRFAGGAIGSVEGSRFAPGRKNFNRFEINGSEGSIVFDLERMNELELYTSQGEESGFRTVLVTEAEHPYVGAWWPPGHILGYEHTFVHTVRDLLLAIDAGEVPSPSFVDGVRNQEVLDAIERSSTSRQWEQVGQG